MPCSIRKKKLFEDDKLNTKYDVYLAFKESEFPENITVRCINDTREVAVGCFREVIDLAADQPRVGRLCNDSYLFTEGNFLYLAVWITVMLPFKIGYGIYGIVVNAKGMHGVC